MSGSTRVAAIRLSTEDLDAARAMVNSVIADFGFIDILVNNAGVGSTGRTVAETEPAEVERLLRVHAMAPHWLSAAVLPSMRTRPRGDIIMISSSATRRMRRNRACSRPRPSARSSSCTGRPAGGRRKSTCSRSTRPSRW